MSNKFTSTAGIVANAGFHKIATVISTKHVGKVQTKYGEKDMQAFVLRVKQTSDDGRVVLADIHLQYHRSFSPQASLVPFLTAMGFEIYHGVEFDFSDCVGKTLPINVSHRRDLHGRIHANVEPVQQVRKQADHDAI